MNKKVIFACILTILLSILYVLFVKDNMFITLTFAVVSLWIYTTFKVLLEFLLFDAVAQACSVNWFIIVMLLYNKYDEFMLNVIFCAFALMKIIFVSQPILNILYLLTILVYTYLIYRRIQELVTVYNVLINNESI